jgi:hypothetical protein
VAEAVAGTDALESVAKDELQHSRPPLRSRSHRSASSRPAACSTLVHPRQPLLVIVCAGLASSPRLAIFRRIFGRCERLRTASNAQETPRSLRRRCSPAPLRSTRGRHETLAELASCRRCAERICSTLAITPERDDSSVTKSAHPSAAVQPGRLKRSRPAAEALADGGRARVIGSGTDPIGASWRPTRCARGLL